MATTIEILQGLEARQTRVVTQTLTRPSTTITAVVTLGSGPSTSTLSPNVPTSTSTSTGPVAPVSSTSSALTSQQLAAILGPVLGFAFLVLLLCCCLSCRRRRQQTESTYVDEYDNASESAVVQQAGTWNGWDRRRVATGTWTTKPPPVWFPPTPRYSYTPYQYRQTSEPQIPGVRRYP
ncbi:hypothetical protein C8A03DRAFT_38018 [Achaetomium macrosporum]|uniref:Uncharacterized protein n=1 Tax=Achaetomium macrosporum TaxID=79813 RepID=A0AAN7C2Q4_9PEZI|nr:hypothetical protein C8A03DRAFT_38018 [Achaetomium macrosporum]